MEKQKTDLSKYIVSVQGKDFITFPGLLAEAHSQGLGAINTELVNTDLTNPIMKATVTIHKGGVGEKTFTGYGDANSKNCATKVQNALIRMAETRAIARALRFACNIDMTALEEIGVEEEDTTPTQRNSFKKPATVVAQNAVGPVETPPVAPNSSGTVVVETTPAPIPETTTKRSFGKRAVAKTEPSFP